MTKFKSERQFGALLTLVSLLFVVIFYLRQQEERVGILLAVAVVVIFTTTYSPATLTAPSNLWLRFGLVLSKVVNPVIMTVAYCLTIVPTAVLLKFFRIKLMQTDLDENCNSYWVKREQQPQSMNDQF